MKSKALVILSTVVMALALMAQNTNQPSPASNGKACACCNHDQADGKMACCTQGAACCSKGNACCKGAGCCQDKDGKACPMMSHDQAGNVTCCAGNKCSKTAKNEKSCCGNKTCERPQAAS